MKSTYKVMAIIAIVLGSLTILESFNSEDFFSFVIGAYLLAHGVLGLQLLKELK